MKHIFRVFTLLFLFTAVSNLTKADEKTNVVKQGTVRGRIKANPSGCLRLH